MLSLAELAREVDGTLFSSDPAHPVANVVYDSRRVKHGDVFVAISGLKDDGARFVASAIDRGAACIIGEQQSLVNTPSSHIVVKNARAALAKAAWALAGKPQRELKLVGVTGTNGKTTVTAALAQLLTRCGHPTGVCGTLGMFFDQHVFESDRTTAEAPELAQAFVEMRDAGCTHVAMEATSIGLVMHRLDELVYDVAVFTNLSRDHLDFHGSWEAYRDAKLQLFTPRHFAGTAVINTDDPEHHYFVKQAAGKVLTFAIDSDADFRAEEILLGASGTTFNLKSPEGSIRIESSLIGRFNVHNMLAIVASAYALGVPLPAIAEHVPHLKPVRGRAEVVPSTAPFSVVVDYAHTPDALVKILSTMRALTKGKLICIIGAGGDRDKGKRPLMAQAAEQLSDTVYLTSDNPRTEIPEQIVKDMEAGVAGSPKILSIVDRRSAIEQALGAACDGDVVVIAGKGHETYQEIHGVKHPFDDAQIASEWLADHGFGR